MPKWMDTDFSENMSKIAQFERQQSWAHLQNATTFHSTSEHNQVFLKKKKRVENTRVQVAKTFNRYSTL